MKSVLLGMSGGVDSSVSAILLKEAGYKVVGITMSLFESGSCCNLGSIIDAKAVCKKLGIEHYTLDFQKEFKENVINKFIEEYQNCRTPNPCIDCNRYLKFGAMYEFAKEHNIDYIATGHYAKVVFSEEYNRYVIRKSKANRKDQTYVLYNIPQELVEHIIFPLGDFESKDQIREIARQHGMLVASKPDSQEICFVPDNDYVNFLERHNIQGMKHGKIVNSQGEILGKHQGLHRYTIGQRRGMGISSSTPLYVLKLNKEKVRAVTPGQAIAFYVGDILAGGGKIEG